MVRSTTDAGRQRPRLELPHTPTKVYYMLLPIFYTLLALYALLGVWCSATPTQEYTQLGRQELRKAAKLYIPHRKLGNASNATILAALLAEGYV